MNINTAYTIYNNSIQSVEPQLAEAIDRIIDDKNKQLEKLDQVELAEAKARIELEAVDGYYSALLKKRVQQLESSLTKHGHLNVFLQQRAVNGWGNHVVDVAMQHIQSLELEIEQLQEILHAVKDFSGEYAPFNSAMAKIQQMAEEGLQ